MVGNVTRWSSDVDSIERTFIPKEAMDDFVGSAIKEGRQKRRGRGGNTNIQLRYGDESHETGMEQSVLDAENQELISTDELTLDDWEDLKLILGILEPFRSWTLLLQGIGTERVQANGYITGVLPAIDELISYLENCKSRYSDPNLYSILSQTVTKQGRFDTMMLIDS